MLPLSSEYKDYVIKVQLSNSEGELSVRMRMQYTCFMVDVKRLGVQCCGLDLAGCGWYRLVCEHSNTLSDSTQLLEQGIC